MKGSIFATYRQIQPDTQRNMDNVTHSRFFFVDIDNDDKDIEANKFEKLLSTNNVTYTAKVNSGGGKHYFIPHTPIDIDDNNREQLIDMSSRLKTWLQDNDVNVDPKIYDIARFTRVWGSFNIKANAYCSPLETRKPTTEEEDINFNFINRIQPKSIPTYSAKHTRCKFCKLIEYCSHTPLNKENTKKNDVLFKNAAAFVRENQRNPNLLKQLVKNQKHNESEIFSSNGWYNKNEIKFNCLELRKWLREYYPELVKETCRLCMLENANKVLYVNDDEKDFKQLKKEYRETGKLPVNKYATFRGVIEPAKDYKVSLQIGKVYKHIIDVEENKTLNLEDVEKQVPKFITVYLDEKQPTEKQMKDMGLKFLYDLKIDFHSYDFICKDIQFKLFVEEELSLGEYFIDGTVVDIYDKLLFGETSKLAGFTKLLFCHTARGTIVKYSSWEEAFKRFTYDQETITDFLSTISFSTGEKFILEQPEMFMQLVYSFLFSSSLMGYPLHLVVSGIPGAGKSKFETALYKKFPHELEPIGAENSTVKGFIPSYFNKRPTRGFLMEAHRILFVDEFFGLITRSNSNDDNESKALQSFNNILTNEERAAGSGVGRLKLKMSAKSYWVTNPLDTMKEDFIWSVKQLEANVVQRFLFFHMDKSWLKWINAQPSHMKDGGVDIDTNDWLALYDFMQDKNLSKVEFDILKIQAIMKELESKVPQEIQEYLYHSRLYNHSAPLIMEGIIKTRILFEKDEDLIAKKVDYNTFYTMIEYIIESWKSGIGDWTANIKKQLSKKHHTMLDLIPKDGIWAEKFRRDCETLGIGKDEFKDNIKYLRMIDLIKRGDKKDKEYGKFYCVIEKEIDLSDVQGTLNL